MTIGSITEFKQILDTLRRLGITHALNWQPTKEEWQKIIFDAGYTISAAACTVIGVGNTEYLFSNGQLDWSGGEKGFGPSGLFMLSREKHSGAVQVRVGYDLSNGGLLPNKGLHAARCAYPGEFARESQNDPEATPKNTEVCSHCKGERVLFKGFHKSKFAALAWLEDPIFEICSFCRGTGKLPHPSVVKDNSSAGSL